MHVIPPDRGNPGHGGFRDIGGVQTPPQPDLENRRRHVPIRKMPERGDRHGFEPRQPLRLGRGQNAVEDGEKISARNAPPPHDDALMDTHEMWRDVKADRVSHLAEDRCQHGGNGSLAVGAGNMKNAESPMGIPVAGEGPTHTAERVPVLRSPAQTLEVRQTVQGRQGIIQCRMVHDTGLYINLKRLKGTAIIRP